MKKNTVKRSHYLSANDYIDKMISYRCRNEENAERYSKCLPRAWTASNAFKQHKFEEGSALINGIIKQLNAVDFSIDKWKFQNRLQFGARVDVGRYLEGRQDCWGGVRRTAKAKRTVRVYTQFGGHCLRSSKELAVSGAVAATITNVLESMGVDTELWAVMCIKNVNTKCDLDVVTCIRIKSANEFADLGAINFFAGDEGMFRGVGFLNVITSTDSMDREVSGGLGHSVPVTAEAIGLDEWEAEHSIIIPSVFDIDKAKEVLKDIIENKVDKAVK